MSKVHLIGNAHTDPVWLWRWQEGYAEVLATFRSALDRIKEFDDFIFTAAGAHYYQWVEEIDPVMFEEIRQRVAEGKWVIVGGWAIQPDCNMPCGESFARHSLYSQNYFLEKFNVISKVGYNVDSFGHTAMLPQILKKSGMNGYVYMRPAEDTEMDYPFKNRTFMWKSPDGTAIPTFRILTRYCTRSESVYACAEECKDVAQEIRDDQIMCFYGVGNHGGGPTIKQILELKKLQNQDMGENYVFSSPNRYFEELDVTNLPEYTGDLHHHASGCYTAVMQIKSLNRMSESHLISAEKAGVMANLLGTLPIPVSLKEAWKPTLFNHFHDIIAGCCIRPAVEDAIYGFGHSIYAADQAENRALQSIAWNIDTSRENPVVLEKEEFRVWERNDNGTPIVIFNTNSFPVKAPVRMGELMKSIEDNEGNLILSQMVRGAMTNGKDDKWESEIIAEIPPMGWKLYWGFRNRENGNCIPTCQNLEQYRLDNPNFTVEFSEDMYIKRIYDKKNNREMLAGNVIPIVIDDADSDTWAHNIFTFDKVVGAFGNGRVICATEGPISQDIRIQYTYGASLLIVDVKLYRELDEVQMYCYVNWQEKHKILKFSFPTTVENGVAVTSIPYGFSNRPADGKEQTMQKWVAVCGEDYGFGLSTDTRTAYSLTDGELRIACLRSTLFADHYGERDEYCEFSDLGEHKFKMAIRPVNGSYHELYHSGELLLKPLPSILGTYHTGKLPAQGQMVEINVPNVTISALKMAEDGNGVIVHCHETDGHPVEAQIKFPAIDTDFYCSFRPQEIKAFRMAEGRVEEVDFLEHPV